MWAKSMLFADQYNVYRQKLSFSLTKLKLGTACFWIISWTKALPCNERQFALLFYSTKCISTSGVCRQVFVNWFWPCASASNCLCLCRMSMSEPYRGEKSAWMTAKGREEEDKTINRSESYFIWAFPVSHRVLCCNPAVAQQRTENSFCLLVVLGLTPKYFNTSIFIIFWMQYFLIDGV